jgi:hypothetical protein
MSVAAEHLVEHERQLLERERPRFVEPACRSPSRKRRIEVTVGAYVG